MIRRVAEYGLSSLFAGWMLEGGADLVFERIERSGALKPEELARLKEDIRSHLQSVRDEGRVQAELLRTAAKVAVSAVPQATGLARTALETVLDLAAQARQSAATDTPEETAAPAAAGASASAQAATSGETP